MACDLIRRARERCREARKAIAAGLDPAIEKKRAKVTARFAVATTFKDVALEWIAKCEREARAEITLDNIRGCSVWRIRLSAPNRSARSARPKRCRFSARLKQRAGTRALLRSAVVSSNDRDRARSRPALRRSQGAGLLRSRCLPLGSRRPPHRQRSILHTQRPAEGSWCSQKCVKNACGVGGHVLEP